MKIGKKSPQKDGERKKTATNPTLGRARNKEMTKMKKAPPKRGPTGMISDVAVAVVGFDVLVLDLTHLALDAPIGEGGVFLLLAP